MHATPPRRLEAVYTRIASTRMAGLPLCNPALQVQAVGFKALDRLGDAPEAAESGWFGVLVTPWCMNLMWLGDAPSCMAAPGATRRHRLAGEDYSFVGGEDPELGRYEMCSLFSPMQDFVDQPSAVAVAQAVLAQLLPPPAPTAFAIRRGLFTAGFSQAAMP